MPAFSFEKIAPPVATDRGAIPETSIAAPQPHATRGVLVRMLDRLTPTRLAKSIQGIDRAREALGS